MIPELEKQLKDAGFPIPDIREGTHKTFTNNDGLIIVPTLEELIEACGERFFLLRQNMDGTFMAIGDAEDEIDASGPTPRIAAARLWLALQATTPHEKEA